jgi:surface protein
MDTSSVTDFGATFQGCTALTTVPLLDTSSATTIASMFSGCTSLQTVPLFNTANVTRMSSTFQGCSALTAVPLFNTANVTDMYNTFISCYNVESGALALYQQASTQTTPPSNHDGTFKNCGRDTVTGAAELAQIPSSWGGTGS